MKKLILIASTIFLVSSVHFAQIPNAGFENWTEGNPDGWYAPNFPGFMPVTQSTVNHSGSYAVQLGVVNTGFGNIPGYIWTGETGVWDGFPVSQAYGSLTGFYQFTRDGEDEIYIIIYMQSAGNYVGTGTLIINSPAASYTQFSVPIEYFAAGVPDTSFIWIALSDSSDGQISSGSFALFDDLEFGGSVDVDDRLNTVPETFSLKQNYPNPFNPSTTIEFSVPQESFVELKVYNILGKEVSTLAYKNYLPGSYKIDFNARDLSSGIYIAKINAASLKSNFNFSKSFKMTLLK